MRKITQCLVYIALLVVSAASHAVSLQSGDVLHFTSGSYVEGYWAGNNFLFDNASVVEQNGLIIGTAAQPTVPGIDQTWTSNVNGIMGNHRTTAPVTVIDGTQLDFSSWIMTVGGSDYALGLTQDIATYTYDGLNFALDYYWDYATDNGSAFLGPLEVSQYHLHLEGTVSSVPLPAAFWLFGSGLLGLVGIAKHRKSA